MSENGHLATVDELFAPSKRRYSIVALPVSGHRVRIQSLTEREVSAYQAEALKKNGTGTIPARIKDSGPRLIIRCSVDVEGNRNMNQAHVAMLSEMDSADANYLHRACMDHCGIREDGIEALEKNSEETPVDA